MEETFTDINFSYDREEIKSFLLIMKDAYEIGKVSTNEAELINEYLIDNDYDKSFYLDADKDDYIDKINTLISIL